MTTPHLHHSLAARQQALDALGLPTRHLARALPGPSRRWKAPTDPAALVQPDSADDVKLVLRYVISSISQDRDGDVLVPRGLEPWLWAYERSPVVLLDHDQGKPVGLSRAEGGPLDVQISDDKVTAGCHFHASTEVAVQSYALARAGVLGMASVGFLPHVGQWMPAREGMQQAAPEVIQMSPRGGMQFLEWEMAEWSLVAVASNRDAVQIALEKRWDGKALCEPLRKALLPLAGPRRPWAHGMALGPRTGAAGKSAVQSLLLEKRAFPAPTDAVAWARDNGWDSSELEELPMAYALVQRSAPICSGGDSREELVDGVHAIRCRASGGCDCAAPTACSCGGSKVAKERKQMDGNGKPEDDPDKGLKPGAKVLKAWKGLHTLAMEMCEEKDVLKACDETDKRFTKVAYKTYPDLAEKLGYSKANGDDDEDADVEVNVGDDDEDEEGDEAAEKALRAFNKQMAVLFGGNG